MGQEPRQSLLLWEDIFDEFRGAPLTPRRERIVKRSRQNDNAIALIRMVAQVGISDGAMKALSRYLDAERKREERAAAKGAA